MSVGDYVNSITSLAGDGTLDIKASAGDQIEIHMIKPQYNADLKVSDSVTDSKLEGLTGGTSYEGLKYEIDNGFFLKVVNSTSASNVIVYSGVKTKE